MCNIKRGKSANGGLHFKRVTADWTPALLNRVFGLSAVVVVGPDAEGASPRSLRSCLSTC